MKIEIPAFVRELMQVLSGAGEESYIVGGSLRDSLLGKSPDDYDLATSADPARMCEVFADYRVIETGLKHGTLTVICDGHPVEITAFRVDGGYTDSRHPDSVSFTRSIEEDLARRDFTVNAMAYNCERGLVDLFGGQEDLGARVIRAVGEPERRFGEDALRIMRAFRFSAQLGFEIEKGTLLAAESCREGLYNIARERIATEFFKLLASDGAQSALLQMRDSNILDCVLCGRIPSERLISLVCELPRSAAARFGFLLCEYSEADAREVIASLKCSNEQKKTALAAFRGASILVREQKDTSRLLCELGGNARYALCASIVLGLSARETLEWLESDHAPHSISELAVNGGDMMRIGFYGRDIGEVLSYLLSRAIDSPEINDRESLLALAKEKYREKEGIKDARERYN